MFSQFIHSKKFVLVCLFVCFSFSSMNILVRKFNCEILILFSLVGGGGEGAHCASADFNKL